jgi:Zn-finger nucleic acid-binding protein
MVGERHDGVAIDRCPACRGLWIDPDQIASWLCEHACDVALDVSLSVTAIPTGRCPRCGHGELHLGLVHGLSFDRCDGCGGHFFSSQVAHVIGRGLWPPRADGCPPSNRVAAAMPDTRISAVLDLLAGLSSPW